MNEETFVSPGVCNMILDVSLDFFSFCTICKVRQADFSIISLAFHLSALKYARVSF